MGPSRRSGVSRQVNRSKGPGGNQRQSMSFHQRHQEEEQARATYQLNVSGLDTNRQKILEEARARSGGQGEGMDTQEQMDIAEDGTNGAEGWVDELPDDLRQEDSFAYALRDIVGS